MPGRDPMLNTGLEELNERECQDLLAGEEVGRIGVVFEGRPEIFPVNYTLDPAGCVVFRTSEGTKLAAAVNRPVVFEVDHVDRSGHKGWSVVVHGVAHHTTVLPDGDRPLAPWVSDRPYLVRITRKSITGRRLVVGD